MDVMSYIIEEGLILVPALWAIGAFLKNTPYLLKDANNWMIPWILLVIGISGTLVILGVTPMNVVQGILITWAAIGGHQQVKQTANH